jgi:hypothetical protein
MKALNEALDRVEDRYKTKIRLKKNELSKALRACCLEQRVGDSKGYAIL